MSQEFKGSALVVVDYCSDYIGHIITIHYNNFKYVKTYTYLKDISTEYELVFVDKNIWLIMVVGGMKFRRIFRVGFWNL